MPDLLFYERPEALDRDKHAKLRFTPPKDYFFAKDVAAVPLAMAEFRMAARHFPIIFNPNGAGNLVALAIFSLTDKGNMFVDEEGHWTASYIPAFVRRYPFALGDIPGKSDDFAAAFDAASDCFNETTGESLFDQDRVATPALVEKLRFMDEYRVASQKTAEFHKTILGASLLRPINIDLVRSADKAKFSVRNILTIDEAKIQGLAADKAASYLADGYLAAIYAHLFSLQNFAILANRMGNPSMEMIPWWTR